MVRDSSFQRRCPFRCRPNEAEHTRHPREGTAARRGKDGTGTQCPRRPGGGTGAARGLAAAGEAGDVGVDDSASESADEAVAGAVVMGLAPGVAAVGGGPRVGDCASKPTEERAVAIPAQVGPAESKGGVCEHSQVDQYAHPVEVGKGGADRGQVRRRRAVSEVEAPHGVIRARTSCASQRAPEGGNVAREVTPFRCAAAPPE